MGVLVLVACDPVLHPTFTVREAPNAPVRFDVLSADGRFVAAHATGAGATVPGAGCWRVNRTHASVVPLPSCNRALRISADGSRILLDTSSGNMLWSSGTTLTPPAGTVFSKDLTFGVFVDTNGAVKTWKSANQSVGLVETAFPRPAGTTSAQAKGISNDGRKVQYTLFGTNPIERFVDLDTNAKIDRSNSSHADTFSLAPSGGGFLQVHEVSHLNTNTNPPTLVIDESWGELAAFPSGKVIRRYINTTQESIDRSFISDDGGTSWLYREQVVDCQELPAPAPCTTSSHAILVANVGAAVFDTGPNAVDAMDSFSNGRYLVYDKLGAPPGTGLPGPVPVTIIDWLSGHIEHLTAAITYTETDPNLCNGAAPCTITARSIRGQVTNDLRVVATTTSTAKGWYEYTASP